MRCKPRFGCQLGQRSRAGRLKRKAYELLETKIERLHAALQAQTESQLLIGKSRALADVITLIERVADTDASVLITGPSGSGKELVARGLHRYSRRKDQPLVAVNTAALPEGLIESELFGHRKGSFTDARADKPGLFQEANGGTLFLDEIGDMAPGLQAKLLRVLQEREVRPVGATRAIPIDVRVLAATNLDLKQAMKAGRFRSDLYYRLAVIDIAIPALRDRPEDILPLAEHFLRRAMARTGKSLKGFSAMAARRLHGYAWPGNVRELENACERVAQTCSCGTVRIGCMSASILFRAGSQAAEVAPPVTPATDTTAPISLDDRLRPQRHE